MDDAASHVSFLPPILVFCGAAVIAVPLFRRLGLGAVLGYLAAGIIIGPAGSGLFSDTDAVRGVADLGVVLLLFIVGLELKLSRLLSMRADILGLGPAQLALTGVLLAAIGIALGLAPRGAAVAGAALALSATSIALQILEERGDLQAPYGRRAFAVLLFQDLSIVPILALVPLLANAGALQSGAVVNQFAAPAMALAAVVAVIVVGRYLLNPFFRVLATSGAREVMTAAALLVVLGAALLMDKVGLSMAMGAFLAGVLLAESNFRHQLEADIEPFRGLLLGLFFMSVGMSIDAGIVARNALFLLVAAPALVLGKILVAAVLARLSGSPWRDALRAGALLATAGEFAFVLLPLAADFGLLPGTRAQTLTALAALSMLLAPLIAKGLEMVIDRARADEPAPAADDFSGARGSIIVIGFGRFGQVVNQVLLAEGVDVTVIDRDVAQIRAAARFGLKVYYGDGTRLDVLRAAGLEHARIACVCVDGRETATRIVELIHAEFPRVLTYVRAYDRVHAIQLMNLDVDCHVREVFKSALSFGRATLEGLGVDPARAQDIERDVERRDVARLVMQKAEGVMGGADLLHAEPVKPEPLTAPKSATKPLNPETRDIIGRAGAP